MSVLDLLAETRMTDVFTTEKRSQIMSRITGTDTMPEILVRSALREAGYRYRLHTSDLPGKPDIVLRKYKTAIFVNGCFWHQHKGCKRLAMPKSAIEYWRPKLERNVEKQKSDINRLREEGWKVHVIWECQTKDGEFLTRKVREIL